MLLVRLVLFPDRGVGGDDAPAVILLGIGEQRLDDEVARALVQRSAIGGGLEQRRVVVLAQIFAERPQHLAPIVELNVDGAFLSEERLLLAVAPIADDRDLIISAI